MRYSGDLKSCGKEGEVNTGLQRINNKDIRKKIWREDICTNRRVHGNKCV